MSEIGTAEPPGRSRASTSASLIVLVAMASRASSASSRCSTRTATSRPSASASASRTSSSSPAGRSPARSPASHATARGALARRARRVRPRRRPARPRDLARDRERGVREARRDRLRVDVLRADRPRADARRASPGLARALPLPRRRRRLAPRRRHRDASLILDAGGDDFVATAGAGIRSTVRERRACCGRSQPLSSCSRRSGSPRSRQAGSSDALPSG